MSMFICSVFLLCPHGFTSMKCTFLYEQGKLKLVTRRFRIKNVFSFFVKPEVQKFSEIRMDLMTYKKVLQT